MVCPGQGASPEHSGDRATPIPQQLFNNWSGGGWNNGDTMSYTPLSRLKQLESTFAENMNAVPGTNAEAAYDIGLGYVRSDRDHDLGR